MRSGQIIEGSQTKLLRRMSPKVTQLYGPAARCKLNLQNRWVWSCASVSGPCVEQIAPGHHGYPRAFDLILGSALEGQLGHQITNATARPFSILQIQLADLGGYLIQCALGLTEAIPSEPPSLARPDRRATVAEKGGGHPFGEPERAHVVATLRRTSYSRCCTSTLHAMRASLLARAVASTLWCNR